MKITAFLLGFGTSFAVSSVTVFILIALNGRRNKGKFKCDMCGERYSKCDNEQFIVKNDIFCKSCYGAFMAPYKIERKDNE